jgi:hypothetical protein
MIAAEILAAWGNTLGDIQHASATVATTSTEVLRAEPEKIRVKLAITYTGAATVYLSLGQPARVGAGICLGPFSTFTLDQREAFNGRVEAIGDGGTSSLAILACHRSTLEAAQ